MALPEWDVVGVALAGGRSRRLGRDKATLELEHRGERLRLLDWTVQRLRSCGGEVAVAAAGALTGVVGASAVSEGPGRGPVAGILGTADAFPERALLVLACDLPLVPVRLLQALQHRSRRERLDVVAADAGRGLEPLCAVYSPHALRFLRQRVADGDHRVHSALSHATSGLAIAFEPAEPEWLLNLNSPEDLSRLESCGPWRVL